MIETKTLTQNLLDAMTFRCIGPVRGGRVVAVAGDPVDVATFYFGAVAGGIWKTEDAGTTWRNVSDGYIQSSSVGALAVSTSDPNVIYAGMGESTIRTDVSYGDGVYKSVDAGQTWQHLGLEETRHIGEIRIHPKNPDVVYVAAFGHAFGSNPERGVYRSTDGGKTWDLVLHKSEKAGAVDISFDPRHPDIIYVSMWEAHRSFWEMSSGGPDSGLWKSIDGGDTWTDITFNKGLPEEGILGKIGVSASPVQAGRVWALVEHSETPGLYRSDDFGATWQLLTDKQELRYRPWYYMHIFADTQDAETVYVNNLGFWKSTDGGKTFTGLATPHGDNHDLWIDPNNNRRMIQSNDGGANVSFTAGTSWSTIYNQLTAQLYHVDTDNREPFYHVYGTQQDNSSISVPADAVDGAIPWSDCYPAGTGESGYIAVHPDDHNIVYVGAVGSSPGGGGALQRYDHRTGQIRLVNVWPEAHGGMGVGELKYRFPWTYPILFSPHDAGIIYTCGNVAFRSTDEGHSWQPISPDLTRADMSKLGPSGGPITKDTSGAEHYATIYTFRESPHEPGLFWAGSDDGLVHISKDGGDTWSDVTPPELPEWAFIRTLEPSPHEPSVCYLAATRYKLDDPAPYLYKTSDYGATWQSITGDLNDRDYTRVIRVDPEVPTLLYAGTESGLYVSLNDGESWLRWQSDDVERALPVTPVYDLVVRGTDLVVATHGRSFWVMDDLTPLRQLAAASADENLRLFPPRKTWRIVPDLFGVWTSSEGKDYAIGLTKAATFISKKDDAGQLRRHFLDTGEGAPKGAIVYYNLPEKLESGSNASLTFLDADGNVIRRFTPKPAGYDALSDDEKALDPGPWMPVAAGVNRFVWDLRYDGATKVLGNKLAGAANIGPLALPGTYTVQLTIVDETEGNETLTESFEVVNDPRVQVSQEDLAAQLDLLLHLRNKISDVHSGINALREVLPQIKTWQKRLSTPDGDPNVAASAAALAEKLEAVEDALILPGEHTDTFGLNQRMRLAPKLASVISIVSSADARPTVQSRELAAEYVGQINEHLESLHGALEEDVAALNAQIRAAQVPVIG